MQTNSKTRKPLQDRQWMEFFKDLLPHLQHVEPRKYLACRQALRETVMNFLIGGTNSQASYTATHDKDPHDNGDSAVSAPKVPVTGSITGTSQLSEGPGAALELDANLPEQHSNQHQPSLTYNDASNECQGGQHFPTDTVGNQCTVSNKGFQQPGTANGAATSAVEEFQQHYTRESAASPSLQLRLLSNDSVQQLATVERVNGSIRYQQHGDKNQHHATTDQVRLHGSGYHSEPAVLAQPIPIDYSANQRDFQSTDHHELHSDNAPNYAKSLDQSSFMNQGYPGLHDRSPTQAHDTAKTITAVGLLF
ncbi:hypothetical protein QAD02_000732 [Eretmocerus hayati]|uniref:Uncharacterized protein n=1 Tax=Eretmocerus hayati TaxID=131215 RepID=A0ACC2NE88_9HYME|nr:hypothetical protein QAD02_000732 [Eretmocerus hayati]